MEYGAKTYSTLPFSDPIIKRDSETYSGYSSELVSVSLAEVTRLISASPAAIPSQTKEANALRSCDHKAVISVFSCRNAPVSFVDQTDLAVYGKLKPRQCFRIAEFTVSNKTSFRRITVSKTAIADQFGIYTAVSRMVDLFIKKIPHIF